MAILHAKKFESCRLRVKGFREILEAHNASTEAKIVVVDEYDSNGAKDIGYKAASDALQATPDLVGIFAINDPAALGAYTAIEEAGKVGQVVLVGFDGQPEGKQAIKEGKIYADPIQFPDQMGVRVVQAIVDHYGGRKPEADALMRRLGLEVPLHVPCRRLTMAQQQILEIAKALLHEARIIVMDEPTASLTPLETRQLFAIIDGLRSRGLGIIYISHRLEEIFRITDRIVVLRDGTKVGERKVNAVDRPGLIAMMVGRPLTEEFPKRERRIGEPRLVVSGLRRGRAVKGVSLEIRRGEVLALTGLVGSGRTETARLIFGDDVGPQPLRRQSAEARARQMACPAV